MGHHGKPWAPCDGCDLPGGTGAGRWAPGQKLRAGCGVDHRSGDEAQAGVLNLGCTLESSGRLDKLLLPRSHLRAYDLIGVSFVAAFLHVSQGVLTHSHGEASGAESRAPGGKKVGRLAAPVRHPHVRTLGCARDKMGPASAKEDWQELHVPGFGLKSKGDLLFPSGLPKLPGPPGQSPDLSAP